MRKRRNKVYHNTVDQGFLHTKAQKKFYYPDGQATNYWPYGKFSGLKITSENRLDVARYLSEEHPDWDIKRIFEEMNKHKKMWKAYKAGKHTFRYKGESFTVLTDVSKARMAAEKLIPIVNVNQEGE